MTTAEPKLDKLQGKVTDRQAADAEAYAQMIRRIADGKEPSAADVERIIAAGFTMARLQADVQTLRRRRECAAQLAAAKGQDAERAKIAQEQQVLEAQAIQARKELAEKLGPLKHRLIQLNDLVSKADDARRVLQATASDELQQEAAAIDAQRATLGKRRAQIDAQRKHALDCCQSELAIVRESSDYQIKRRHQEQAEQFKQSAAEREKDLAGIDAEISKLCDVEAQIIERMMEP